VNQYKSKVGEADEDEEPRWSPRRLRTKFVSKKIKNQDSVHGD